MFEIWIPVTLFIVFIMIAQIASPPEYQWMRNTVSELAAQKYGNRKIMQAGFISFGITLSGFMIFGIIVEKVLPYQGIPILIYALSVGMSGFFCTSPFVPEVDYSTREAKLHSLFAQVAGFSFMTAIMICIVSSADIKVKILHALAGVLVMGCSLLFAKVPDYRGLFQRVMYLGSFLWLIYAYGNI